MNLSVLFGYFVKSLIVSELRGFNGGGRGGEGGIMYWKLEVNARSGAGGRAGAGRRFLTG